MIISHQFFAFAQSKRQNFDSYLAGASDDWKTRRGTVLALGGYRRCSAVADSAAMLDDVTRMLGGSPSLISWAARAAQRGVRAVNHPQGCREEAMKALENWGWPLKVQFRF